MRIPENCDLLLILSLIRQESGFNPNIVNPNSGATGLMQLMLATFNEHAATARLKKADRTNPVHNIITGCMELNRCLDMFGDLRLALTAFNWGNGNLSRFLAQAKTRDWETLKNFKGVKLNRKTGKDEVWTMPKEAKEYADRIFKHYRDPETLEMIDDYLKVIQ